MDEAYTIGIRLALDDGVSTGIALIGRDLDKLDGAISQTTAGLARLADAARATLAGAAASVRAPHGRPATAESKPEAEPVTREASRAPTPVPQAKDRVVAPATPQDAKEYAVAPVPARVEPPAVIPAQAERGAGEQATAARARIAEAASATPVPQPPTVATVVPERVSPERPVAAANAKAPSMPTEQAGAAPARAALPPERPAAAPADAGRRRATPETLPVTIALRRDRPAPNAPATFASTARAVTASAPATAVAGAANKAEWDTTRIARAPADAGDVRQAASLPSRTQTQSPGAARPRNAAPQVVEPGRRETSAQEVPAARAMSRSGAVLAASRLWSPAASPAVPAAPAARQPPPAPAQASSEPDRSESNIYLDGEVVGRWLVERLGRDAGRPPTGTTGIDGRLSPAWFPGALQ